MYVSPVLLLWGPPTLILKKCSKDGGMIQNHGLGLPCVSAQVGWWPRKLGEERDGQIPHWGSSLKQEDEDGVAHHVWEDIFLPWLQDTGISFFCDIWPLNAFVSFPLPTQKGILWLVKCFRTIKLLLAYESFALFLSAVMSHKLPYDKSCVCVWLFPAPSIWVYGNVAGGNLCWERFGEESLSFMCLWAVPAGNKSQNLREPVFPHWEMGL